MNFWTELREGLLISFAAIHANKMRAALTTLVSIIRVTAPINLFMLGAEVFSEFYAGGAHVASARYLFLGLHGHSELVPWIWTAISFNVFAESP